jgi:hypothetical protein
METTTMLPQMISMKRIFQLGGLAVAILSCPAPAAADSLTFSSLGSGSWVTLQLAGVTETGWAGEIKWLYKTPTDTIGSIVTTYCADLFDDAKLPAQNVSTTTTNALDASIAAGTSISLNALPNAGAKAAYLVDTFAAGAHGSSDAAAGLQIAIWQAMFGTGSFTYSAGLGVITAATNYYGSLTTALLLNPSAVYSSSARYFDVANDAAHSMGNAFGQDQIDPIVGSPEPASVLMVVFGMLIALTYQSVFRLRLRRVRAQ